jgi:phage protein D
MAQERLILITSTGVFNPPRTELLSLEVELDNELAGMFKLRLATRLQPNGSWTYVDDERFQAWKPLIIRAGFNTTEELISGYITHIKPDFQRDPAHCTVEIWGMDRSVLMDREEKLLAWRQKTDSAIAAEIFRSHNFIPDVALTPVEHDETVSTIIQRETDMQFLKRLALRNGYECYVDGNFGCFKPPRLEGNPQPLLAVHCDASETNVNYFSLQLNALTPTNVAMMQVDRLNKKTRETAVDSSLQPVLGRRAASEILPPHVRPPGQVYVSGNPTTGLAEMDILCQELYHQAAWFLNAEGEIDGNHYAHVLKPHQTVTIKGIGEAYKGVYYVTHVTHVFRASGYTQLFRAKRNALMPTGAEDFARFTPKPNPYLFDPVPYASEPRETKPNPY